MVERLTRAEILELAGAKRVSKTTKKKISKKRVTSRKTLSPEKKAEKKRLQKELNRIRRHLESAERRLQKTTDKKDRTVLNRQINNLIVAKSYLATKIREL